jgi:flagellar protein FliO/FliZ
MGLSDIMPLILSLVAIAAVLYLCYLLSKFLAGRASKAANTANIRILERVALAQDKGLAIAEICGAYYLIAFSNSSVELLREIDSEKIRHADSGMKQNFMDIFNAALKGRLDLTGNDRKHNTSEK